MMIMITDYTNEHCPRSERIKSGYELEWGIGSGDWGMDWDLGLN